MTRAARQPRKQGGDQSVQYLETRQGFVTTGFCDGLFLFDAAGQGQLDRRPRRARTGSMWRAVLGGNLYSACAIVLMFFLVDGVSALVHKGSVCLHRNGLTIVSIRRCQQKFVNHMVMV